MIIYGNKVTLRAMEMNDLQLARALYNDPNIDKLVTEWAFPISEYAQNKWYEDNFQSKENIYLIIEDDENNSVGMVSITGIDWKNRKAHYGIKILNESARTKGIGSDSLMAIMRYSFDELQLNRLDSCWFEDNTPSKNMHIKYGWIVEGIRRNYIFKNGKYKNLEIAGILKEEYYEIANKTNYWSR